MAAPESRTPGRDDSNRRIPVLQEMYDNIWFLFLLSGLVVLVFYLIWGLIDLVNVPTLP